MIVIPDNACVNSSIFCAADTGTVSVRYFGQSLLATLKGKWRESGTDDMVVDWELELHGEVRAGKDRRLGWKEGSGWRETGHESGMGHGRGD